MVRDISDSLTTHAATVELKTGQVSLGLQKAMIGIPRERRPEYGRHHRAELGFSSCVREILEETTAQGRLTLEPECLENLTDHHREGSKEMKRAPETLRQFPVSVFAIRLTLWKKGIRFMRHHQRTAYHPEGNRYIERFHRRPKDESGHRNIEACV